MNIEEIKEIIAALENTGIVEFEFEKSGMKVRIKKEGASYVPQVSANGTQIQHAHADRQRPSRTGGEEGIQPEENPVAPKRVIKSPIVGTFYRSASPESEPYIEVGSVVKKGQIVCIIEAMKLMNEIESDIDGKVVEILTENAHPVEYGEPLFAVEPV